jgi:hypothetical protein
VQNTMGGNPAMDAACAATSSGSRAATHEEAMSRTAAHGFSAPPAPFGGLGCIFLPNLGANSLKAHQKTRPR